MDGVGFSAVIVSHQPQGGFLLLPGPGSNWTLRVLSFLLVCCVFFKVSVIAVLPLTNDNIFSKLEEQVICVDGAILLPHVSI